uniref:Uncharacterized protein n=1 Tax=Glossina palpalis gambiensis TaxID=67801 RepID=A0A1B0B040_9MUSC
MKFLTYLLSLIAIVKAGILHHHEGNIYKVKLISRQNVDNFENIRKSAPIIKVIHQGLIESEPVVYKVIHDYSIDGNVYHKSNYDTPQVIKVIHENSAPQVTKYSHETNNLNDHFHEPEVLKIIHENPETGHINHAPERIIHLIHEHKDHVAIDIPRVTDASSDIHQHENNIQMPETSILPPIIEPAPVFDTAAIAMDALYESPAFSIPEPAPAETYGTPPLSH